MIDVPGYKCFKNDRAVGRGGGGSAGGGVLLTDSCQSLVLSPHPQPSA